MKKKYSIEDVTSVVGMRCEIAGKSKDIFFSNVKPFYEADEESLVWVHPKKEIDISSTAAKLIIVHNSFSLPENLLTQKCFLRVEDPRLALIRVIEKYFARKPVYGVHPTAVIHPDAKIDSKVSIGPFCYIGKSQIGEGAVLEGHCYIYDNVTIGRNVMLHAGAVIGGDGFGYSRTKSNSFEKFPHVGGVVVEDDVEIGANACIDRGTLGMTLIKQGAKIDNLVHIAHNVVIGKNAAVIAHSQIAGSVVVGDNAWIAPSATVSNVGTIGEGAYIGIGAVVTQSVNDGEKVFGNPAKPLITPKRN